MALSCTSTGCLAMAAATSIPLRAAAFVAIGSICLVKVFYDVDRNLPTQAVQVSAINRLRVQISADLFVCAAGGNVLFEVLGLSGAISDSATLHAYLVLDLVGKLGVSHLLCRNPQAYNCATDYAARARAAPLQPS